MRIDESINNNNNNITILLLDLKKNRIKLTV